MITVHCVDVSGSMSNSQIQQAQREVMVRFKPKDIVVMFSIGYFRVSDLERCFTTYPFGDTSRGGGTDARKVLQFVQEQKALSILYSDGMMLEEERNSFNEFVEI